MLIKGKTQEEPSFNKNIMQMVFILVQFILMLNMTNWLPFTMIIKKISKTD